MKIRLTVTAEDIKQGVPHCNTDCPIARAVKSAIKFKHKRTVRVYSTHTKFTRIIRRVWHPQSVERFINRFDAGKIVRPFSFELDLPERYLKAA